jgi:hypothetical protein
LAVEVVLPVRLFRCLLGQLDDLDRRRDSDVRRDQRGFEFFERFSIQFRRARNDPFDFGREFFLRLAQSVPEFLEQVH